MLEFSIRVYLGGDEVLDDLEKEAFIEDITSSIRHSFSQLVGVEVIANVIMK